MLADNQILEITNWIINHPFNYVEYNCPYGFDLENPSSCYLDFIKDPDIINEYEDPLNGSMNSQPIENGCDFIFHHGPRKKDRCNRPVDPSMTKCAFHSALIFQDDIRSYIQSFHNKFNRQ